MRDLIDREALLRQIDIDSEGEPGYYGDTWKFIDTIKRMPSALGTNLAEVGTDCISRQAAIDDIWTVSPLARLDRKWVDRWLRQLPPAQPTFDARDTQYNLPIGTDLISRAQAIEAFRTYFMDGFDEDKWWNSTHVLAAIEGLPPAEPKRGWWIEIINSRGVVVALRCSRCEKSPRHGVRSDFCPNCGADMREVTT